MSEHQSWNFGGIEAGAGSIAGAVQTVHGLLDEGKQSLGKLAEAWGGSGSEAYQAVQHNWDNTSKELNDSLQSLSQRISEAGQTMAQTESGVTGMFT
ncbi:WXG100 family type VII secretion target [Mycobacterium shigaense]|uniref:ESAT-6-like protein n=1 Tax=Mycobacterium shigaense TaxID=722731 RepID=A0A1Z4EQ02_9MYCO|nr:WXG100 family type VII secretion target [Mycobacterium shigaense]MEA1121537.1 WXG100 family type VII secretion target [Mycobacterium shigaense]PRI15179.1 WXG100 family type VII secretion target [Mycobacterium shigaense]BAX95049.1 ESAT-6-like protein EsxA [Mycobacterium shigaense]